MYILQVGGILKSNYLFIYIGHTEYGIIVKDSSDLQGKMFDNNTSHITLGKYFNIFNYY